LRNSMTLASPFMVVLPSTDNVDYTNSTRRSTE
jgi:hypothetical protein